MQAGLPAQEFIPNHLSESSNLLPEAPQPTTSVQDLQLGKGDLGSNPRRYLEDSSHLLASRLYGAEEVLEGYPSGQALASC